MQENYESASIKSSQAPPLPPPPPPPTPSASHETVLEFRQAVRSLRGVSILQVLLDEVRQLPFREKKRRLGGVGGDDELVHLLVQEMSDVLARSFLHVDFSSNARDVRSSDWGQLVSCRRSESGTVGTYFLQTLCRDGGEGGHAGSQHSRHEVVVAKAITLEDFEKTSLVNELATKHFHILCPQTRYIDRHDAEFVELQEKIFALFAPLHSPLFPTQLFSQKGVLLLEFVKGTPLCHRTQGQRPLLQGDYHALGKLFLLDLLVRNTDRLPCAKAMPRPHTHPNLLVAHTNTHSTATHLHHSNVHAHSHSLRPLQLLDEQGNAGNIMFGASEGQVWSIDPEMQTEVGEGVEAAYLDGVESAVREIVHAEASLPSMKALNSLLYCPIDGLAGILDCSLHDLPAWGALEPHQLGALQSVLDMVRVRVAADQRHFPKHPCSPRIPAPPDTADERLWREWMRQNCPCAVRDVLQFVALHTGYGTPEYAASAFERGVRDGLAAAAAFRRQYGQTKVEAEEQRAGHIAFILRVIERLEHLLVQ
eukprot:gene29684-35830_t